MLTKTTTKKILNIIKGKERESVLPLWLMRQAGRYLPEYREVRSKAGDFLTLCYTPELAAEVTLQPIRRFGFDAAIIFSDILVIPQALGMDLRFEENHGPVLGILERPDEVSRKELDLNMLAPVYEALRLVHAALPSSTTLIGFAGAAWTLFCYMMEGKSTHDFVRARRMLIEEREASDRLFSILEDSIVQHLSLQIEAGAECVQLFDSWAGVLSAPFLESHVLASHRRIVSRVKAKYRNVPVFGFPRGVGNFYERYAKESGVDVVVMDSGVCIEALLAQTDLVLQGNLDPMILAYGTEEQLSAEIMRIKHAFGDRNCIFNLGHGILPDTPLERVYQLVEEVRKK